MGDAAGEPPVQSDPTSSCCEGEHPPADLMAIYLACDEAPGDTDQLIADFRGFGDAGNPA